MPQHGASDIKDVVGDRLRAVVSKLHIHNLTKQVQKNTHNRFDWLVATTDRKKQRYQVDSGLSRTWAQS